MPLLRHSAAGLAALALEGTLGVRIAKQMRLQAGHRPAPAELRSWDRSLPVLANDLLDAGLGGVEVIVEHQLPLTSRRVDAILAGSHPRTGAPSYVVVELKQWSRSAAFESDPGLVLVEGYPRDPRLHPVTQVRGYCDYLTDFTRSLHEAPDAVAGIAYLHNAVDADVASLLALPQDQRGRLFTGGRRGDLLAFLRSRLDADTPGGPYADQLLASPAAPSRQLLAVAAEEIRHREQFTLLDEQRLAYDLVLHTVDSARSQDTKSVVVVTGGPGSGKSVIALSCSGSSPVAAGASCMLPALVASPRRCARSPAEAHVRPRVCSPTSTPSWTPSETVLTSSCSTRPTACGRPQPRGGRALSIAPGVTRSTSSSRRPACLSSSSTSTR